MRWPDWRSRLGRDVSSTSSGSIWTSTAGSASNSATVSPATRLRVGQRAASVSERACCSLPRAPRGRVSERRAAGCYLSPSPREDRRVSRPAACVRPAGHTASGPARGEGGIRWRGGQPGGGGAGGGVTGKGALYFLYSPLFSFSSSAWRFYRSPLFSLQPALARWRRGSSRGHEGGGGWEAPAGGWPGTERAHMAGRIRRWPMMEWHVNAMTVLGLPPGATTRRSGASSTVRSSA
jgi:hypothetical protein